MLGPIYCVIANDGEGRQMSTQKFIHHSTHYDGCNFFEEIIREKISQFIKKNIFFAIRKKLPKCEPKEVGELEDYVKVLGDCVLGKLAIPTVSLAKRNVPNISNKAR